MEKQEDWCPAELMDSEDRLFIAYTSGTSNPEPKGIVHSQAGYLLYVAMTLKVQLYSSIIVFITMETILLFTYTIKLHP